MRTTKTRVIGLFLFGVFLAAACDSGDDSNATGDSGAPERDAGQNDGGPGDAGHEDAGDEAGVETTLIVQDALGGLVEGALVTFGDQSQTTDVQGAARFQVAPGSLFHFRVSHELYHDYHVYGSTGQTDLVYVTLVSSRGLYDQVMGAIGVVPDADRGLVVVSVHDLLNIPTVGARVSIDTRYETAFTLMGIMPVESDELLENAESFITFTNVETGTVTPTIEPPDGYTCNVFFEGPETMEMKVFADSISVITITCLPDA